MECQFCRGGLDLQKVCGKLHSVVNENCNCVAHHKCMQYSSNLQQYKFPQFGGFFIEDVEREVKRGQKLKCSVCRRKGATAGCAFKECKRTYHYPCARKADGVRICRFVKYASQDVDTNSTVILYYIFCNSAHQTICTENLRLASADELSSNSEDDVEDGAAEELSKCTTNGDMFQQLFPSSSSSDDNANLQTKPINQVDSSTCVVGKVPLPRTMDVKKNSVGTSSATVNKNAVGNISILDATVSATPPSLARHVNHNLVDSVSASGCRRDRLCLKSSQRKRKAREMDCENEEATQFEPMLQNRESLNDCLNWNSSNKRARIDSSTETLSGTETTGIGKSAETVRLNNGCVAESSFNNGFLPNLNIPDPMDDQIHFKQPSNFPNICASSSRKKSKKMSNPDRSQPVITSFLTPTKKLGMAVTANCATEVIKVTKDKPKAQKRLQLSGTSAKSKKNVTRTRLINKAEKIQDDFYPLPSSILPIPEMNVSTKMKMENVDTSPITEVTVSPITEIVSAAKEFVSSVSPGFSGCLERVSKPSKRSTSMSGIPELAFNPRTLKQKLPSTIRKLVLDGRGNFSMLTEIESLFKPLSDSSNDAGESSESRDIDSDVIDNSMSTVSSPSYEELSSTFFLHQMEDNADIDRVCGLCIPVTEESLDDRTSKALLKFAICSLDLVEENIFLWQITGLNEIQIIGIILQFSRYLRDKNDLELLKKLFKGKCFDADSLLDSEMSLTKENVEAIRQEIEQNFSEAEKKYGRCVGKLCSFEDLRISAAFLILSNTNDNTSAARSSLPKYPRVHICSEDTKFVISYNLCDAQRMIISDNEYENLKWWLETFDYSTVLFYPTENVLQSSNTPSVANRLKNYFMQRTVPGGDTSFVFIQRTNPDLLIYRPFICKLLAFVKEELLTCNHDACIVFDVGQDLRIARLADVVLPCLIGDEGLSYCFEVEAVSGTNPMFSPVSCLVIHLLLKFPENC